MASESDVWHQSGLKCRRPAEGFGTMLGAFREGFEWLLVWLDDHFGSFGTMVGACKPPCWGTLLGRLWHHALSDKH